jgi:hypothetical protein
MVIACAYQAALQTKGSAACTWAHVFECKRWNLCRVHHPQPMLRSLIMAPPSYQGWLVAFAFIAVAEFREWLWSRRKQCK